MKALLKLVYGIKVNLAIQEQQLNHSIPGKAEKAAKARERFAKRPYRVEGDLELERPIVTVGDVPNRAAPTELQGYLQGENGMYPVFTQTKVGPIKKMSVLDELARMFEAKGWTRINDSSYKNSKITVGDITTENVGMLNGKPVIFDPEAAYNEDIIKVSNAKFKNK